MFNLFLYINFLEASKGIEPSFVSFRGSELVLTKPFILILQIYKEVLHYQKYF